MKLYSSKDGKNEFSQKTIIDANIVFRKAYNEIASKGGEVDTAITYGVIKVMDFMADSFSKVKVNA